MVDHQQRMIIRLSSVLAGVAGVVFILYRSWDVVLPPGSSLRHTVIGSGVKAGAISRRVSNEMNCRCCGSIPLRQSLSIRHSPMELAAVLPVLRLQGLNKSGFQAVGLLVDYGQLSLSSLPSLRRK
jgi:hypothetical protein